MKQALAVLTLSIALACNGYDAPAAPARVLTTITVSLADASIEVGQATTATAAGVDQNGGPIALGTITWSSTAQDVAGISPTTGAIHGIAPGTAEIRATVDGKIGMRTITISKAAGIRINEIQSHGGAGGGFVELFNPTTSEVDLSGWTLVDNNLLSPSFTFPPGTVIRPDAYRVITEVNLPFIIDDADAAHLFSRFGVQVDQASWAVQPPAGAGRCPDGTGAFVNMTSITRGGTNIC